MFSDIHSRKLQEKEIDHNRKTVAYVATEISDVTADTKLSDAVDSKEGRDTIQRELDRLTKWA